NHVNKFIDFSSVRGGGSTKYNGSTKLCTNIYCHSNGNPGSLVYVNPAAWNSATTYGCNGCHGTSGFGAPDYANGGAGTTTANSHSKHVSQLNITDTTGCAVCHRRTVDMATANKLRNYSTLHLNGTANVTFNTTRAGSSATWTSGTGTCSSVICHGNGLGAYQSPQWGATDNCGFCHPIASLGGAHAKHLDLTQTPVFYTFTANRSSGDDSTGKYYFGCSSCHPLVNGNHTSGTIVLDLRPSVAGVGTLRSKNSAAITATGPAGTTNGGTTADSVSGSVVKCLNIYCHSNGYSTSMVYANTPNWYGGSFTGDRCANCHGNSPNSTIAGSPAHYNSNFLGTGITGGHVVGIHYDGIFSGTNGLATPGTGTTNSHGNALYSTTINCNICHYATVTSANNDKNIVCNTCHNGIQATLRGNATIANKANHVNGSVKVAFNSINEFSKAQLRTGSQGTAPYNTAWTRNSGYKGAGSYDSAQAVFNTAAMWDSSTKTCSNIACHNGQSVTWGSTGGATTCQSCHPSL
ncbi:CxxxxCH/CxxCH domain c-type cytochrome, partial [Geobacter argillaceus]|uniref:CxxxxCH/CxxCH domain c-type cytochrome n=1 Tax=Geobacter argillaceus TaxID=345631 RepID=UPI0011A11945